jgi:Multiubiquitin
MSELVQDAKVRISINRETYEAPNPVTAAKLYEWAEADEHEKLFREVFGENDDELIPRAAAEVRLSNGQHFYSQRAIDVVVNAELKEVAKRRLSFEDVVKLAYPVPPPGQNILYTVVYRHGPPHHSKGTLVAGESVKVKEGMVFNVSATDRS